MTTLLPPSGDALVGRNNPAQPESRHGIWHILIPGNPQKCVCGVLLWEGSPKTNLRNIKGRELCHACWPWETSDAKINISIGVPTPEFWPHSASGAVEQVSTDKEDKDD